MGILSDFKLRFFQIAAGLQDFTAVTKVIQATGHSLYGFGRRCFKIREMDFKPCFEAITWSLFTLKASNVVE